MRMSQGASWFIAVALGVSALGAQEEHGFTPIQIERGEAIFLLQCAICHGPDGDQIPGTDLASGEFRHATAQRDLIGIIQKGIPGTPMPPGNYSDEQAQMIVAYLFSLRPSAPVAGSKLRGDANRGKQIFEGRGQCLNCHRVNGAGESFLGPDLGEIGAARRSASLQLSLTDPSAEIRAGSRTVRAIRKDGTIILARLLNQDTESLQVLTGEGKLISLSKSGLRDFDIMRESPMPSYKGKLNEQELADVVAYLTTLKGSGR
jgi:putative heme-binding domain-containing protein